MNLKKILIALIVSVTIVYSESRKVIFARNTTANAIRQAERERVERLRDSQPVMGTIINIQTNCKPGFLYESQFHHRCRKIA